MRLKEFERFALAYAPGNAVINSIDGTIKNLSKAGNRPVSFVQLVVRKPLASEAQLWQAVDQTINAFSDKSNFVKQPGLEFLVRVTGRKQLPAALDLLQLKEGKNEGLLVAVAPTPAEARAAYLQAAKSLDFQETPLDWAAHAKKNQAFLLKAYGLTKEALKVASLEQLVREKIALVALES